jgi:hypothetical protein
MKLKGAKKGQEVFHFECNYCSKSFQGHSNSTLLKHLRSNHPKKCPELLPKENTNKPVRNFFVKTSMKKPSYEPDVFMGKPIESNPAQPRTPASPAPSPVQIKFQDVEYFTGTAKGVNVLARL